ncbi:aspartyl/asparaginyl beta-hydroxylase domain-containing protein [uncultured Parasphingorhabdus sp.]|uniref:aspartyl/asparaginyl beta-hydroxylase domain-containing protein n=1 Tax=uncultured Parasphingorhabdus sp. TaxID=2709694 RepID=UPI002AA6448E|nr:aspartyl/asparaginyl beta-hydroxylase domain-containing protein [uncultured Parasphingorhabdus sp.]
MKAPSTSPVTRLILERSDPGTLGVLPRVTKPEMVRHLAPVDINLLQAKVSRLSEMAWAKEDEGKPNRFPCFHHTQHILFRFIPDNRNAANFVSYPSWPLWAPLLLPVMQSAIVPYNFTRPVFPKVMLARLLAKRHIDLHRDGAGANLHTHKIHVPLQTNDAVRFQFANAQFQLHVGEAYEVNNITRHGGYNDGDEHRVHLIFEVFDAAAATKMNS